eukprot:9153581-Alexandrium_andersonii.AAC.1
MRELVFDNDCVAHQYHLMTKASLLALDTIAKRVGCTYSLYSALAKFMNVWRYLAGQIFQDRLHDP